MTMLDYDNVPVGKRIRNIETNEIFGILGSHPDIDDAINGVRGEVMKIMNMETLKENEIFSSGKTSSIFELIQE